MANPQSTDALTSSPPALTSSAGWDSGTNHYFHSLAYTISPTSASSFCKPTTLAPSPSTGHLQTWKKTGLEKNSHCHALWSLSFLIALITCSCTGYLLVYCINGLSTLNYMSIPRGYGSLSLEFKQWIQSLACTFIFGGSKITADGDCSQEIKRHLLLGRKAMTNLDSILKSRDITLPTKVCIVKAMVFQ